LSLTLDKLSLKFSNFSNLSPIFLYTS
jgi:hypothetical protein